MPYTQITLEPTDTISATLEGGAYRVLIRSRRNEKGVVLVMNDDAYRGLRAALEAASRDGPTIEQIGYALRALGCGEAKITHNAEAGTPSRAFVAEIPGVMIANLIAGGPHFRAMGVGHDRQTVLRSLFATLTEISEAHCVVAHAGGKVECLRWSPAARTWATIPVADLG